jgi:type IV secretory pathway TrbL component
MRLVLLNPPELARRLRDGAVSSRDKLIYLVIVTVLGIAAGSSVVAHLMYEGELTDMDIANDIITLLFEVALILIAYRINQRGNAMDFIERYICISVPLTLRVFVVMTIIAFIIASFLPLPPQLLVPLFQLACFAYAYRLLVQSFNIMAAGK